MIVRAPTLWHLGAIFLVFLSQAATTAFGLVSVWLVLTGDLTAWPVLPIAIAMIVTGCAEHLVGYITKSLGAA